MFWLARPPYVRRALAAGLVLATAWFELAPDATVPHPFAVATFPAGREVTRSDFELRRTPFGLLPPVEVVGVLTAPVSAGEPLLPSMLGSVPSVPEGWWALEMPAPSGTVAGAEVRLAAADDHGATLIPGLVVTVTEDDSFEGSTALVAVPESQAATAVTALGRGTLVLLVGPGPQPATG